MDFAMLLNLALAGFGIAYAFLYVTFASLAMLGAAFSGGAHGYWVNGHWVSIIQVY